MVIKTYIKVQKNEAEGGYYDHIQLKIKNKNSGDC